MSDSDKTEKKKHNTRKQIAENLGWSTVDGVKMEYIYTCEICGEEVQETSLENLHDKTFGIVGSGDIVCFGCAKKEKIQTWVRLGADKTEKYPGIDD